MDSMHAVMFALTETAENKINAPRLSIFQIEYLVNVT